MHCTEARPSAVATWMDNHHNESGRTSEQTVLVIAYHSIQAYNGRRNEVRDIAWIVSSFGNIKFGPEYKNVVKDPFSLVETPEDLAWFLVIGVA